MVHALSGFVIVTSANGATRFAVAASLAGVEIYRAVGFIEIGRGETLLLSGRPIACVLRKDLHVGSST